MGKRKLLLSDRKEGTRDKNTPLTDIERETVEGYISDVNKIIDAISNQIAKK